MKTSQDCKSVRQNGAYTATRKHEVNLRRNPTIHFQIGLVLALLVSLFFVEMRLPDKKQLAQELSLDDEPIWIDAYRLQPEKIVRTKAKVKPKAQVPIEPEELDVVPDDTENLEKEIFETTEVDKEAKIEEYVPYEEYVEPVKPVPFIAVEDVPVFPGCEKERDNQARRDCMNSKINKFVRKKFNTGRAEGLGLEGVNQIRTIFTIDESGAVVDVLVQAPHPKLEAEARRVIGLFPEMTPGRQRGKAVKVQYALPIVFQVRD